MHACVSDCRFVTMKHNRHTAPRTSSELNTLSRKDATQVLCGPTCKALSVHHKITHQLECGPMPNMTAALPNISGALCSTPQSLANAHYQSAVQ